MKRGKYFYAMLTKILKSIFVRFLSFFYIKGSNEKSQPGESQQNQKYFIISKKKCLKHLCNIE